MIPRQSRSNFNSKRVLKALERGEEIPEPMSIIEEACHRILGLEEKLENIRIAFGQLREFVEREVK